MDLVALRTGNVAQGVGASIPVMKVECCVCGMTFKAYERSGLSWEVPDIDQRPVVASRLFPFLCVQFDFFLGQALDRQTAWAMAGLAIHQWHPGFF